MSKRTNPPRLQGRPPKHGGRILERVLRENALDRRTRTAKMLRELQDDLAADAGGWENITTRERLLIERCAATALICSSIENFTFKQDSPIDSAAELIPVLRKGYATHAANLSRMLQALGLRPDKADKLPSLTEYLNSGRDADAEPTEV